MDEGIKVGALADRTGITVRTLHFYEEIGLVRPSARDGAGHRRYAAADVVRLQRVVSLRALGLPLEEIGDLLDGRQTDPVPLLRSNAARLRDAAAKAEALAARLDGLAERMCRADDPDTDELLDLVAAQEGVRTSFEQHYTPEQLAQLEARRRTLGSDGMAQHHAEWAALIAEVRAHAEAGTDPGSDAVQALMLRWREKVTAFTGGDPDLRANLERQWRERPVAMAERSGIDPVLRDYVQRAMAPR